MICYPLTGDNWPPIPAPLACSLFSWNGTSISIVLQDVTYSPSLTSLFFGLTPLSSSSAALVWIDQGRNNRLQAGEWTEDTSPPLSSLMESSLLFFLFPATFFFPVVISTQNDTLVFGSTILLNTGDASGVLPNGQYPDIVAQTLNPNQFVVLYR
jgi:hypothetical protein